VPLRGSIEVPTSPLLQFCMSLSAADDSVVSHAPAGSLEMSPNVPAKATDGAEVAHAALWSEFQRRRQEDRQRRPKRLSDVRQILKEVQQERHQNGEGASCENSLSAISLDTLVAQRSSSPTKKSEIMQLLAEVQEQRNSAGSIDIRHPSAPSGIIKGTTHTSQTQARDSAEQAHDTCSSASPEKNDQDGHPAVHSAKLIQNPSYVPATDHIPSLPKQSDRAAAKNSHQDKQCAAKQNSNRPPSQAGVRRPRRQSSGTCLRRQSSLEESRRHQFGAAVSTAFDGPLAEQWAANLRLSKATSQKADSLHRGVQPYPAGEWDDRTSCPQTFQGFTSHSKPCPQDAPTGTRSRRRNHLSSFKHPWPWDERTTCPTTFNDFLDLTASPPPKNRSNNAEIPETCLSTETKHPEVAPPG